MSAHPVPDWHEYHRASAVTARFGAWTPAELMSYVGLGVASETAEVVAEIHMALRDSSAMPRDRITDELGDVLWYAARVAELIDITLADAPRPDISTRSTGWDGRAVVAGSCLGLVTAAGEIAGQIKKALRDDEGTLTEVGQARIMDQLGALLSYATIIAGSVNATLRDAVETNIAKVHRRLANGTLSGSGDR